MENKRILVIGGSGYVGREIVAKLIKEKYDVTILSRNPKAESGVKSIKGSVLDKKFLIDNTKNLDIIIYLAAIVRSFNKSNYNENVIGVKNIIEAMQINNVRKIVYFSTQNVHIKKTGHYGNSKKRSEKLILDSNLDYIIIRPNYIYGIDKQNDFYRLFKITKTLRICPIIGTGNNKFQPINKKDVAEITINLVKKFKPGMIIDISGKTTISINDVVNYIIKYSKIRFIKIHIPIVLLKLFRVIIPFDVDGLDADRTSHLKKGSYHPTFNINEDLNKIFEL